MKALTENQQSIIDALTSEFNRINSTPKATTFNLVDASKLASITDEIARNKAEAEADKKYWRELAMAEAERVAALIQQDMPMACVERFGKSNGKVDCSSVTIQRQRGNAHHEDSVSFSVEVILGEYVEQSHKCGYHKSIGLQYSYYDSPSSAAKYSSVEELFEKSNICDAIRRKILR